MGANIVFAQGEFAPNTRAGQQLLAHELTHVVQQHRASPNRGAHGPSVSSPGDAAEHEASRGAQAFVDGGNAGSIVEVPSGEIQRDGENVCELPPVTVGTFELNPALENISIPANMKAKVRVSQPAIGGGH